MNVEKHRSGGVCEIGGVNLTACQLPDEPCINRTEKKVSVFGGILCAIGMLILRLPYAAMIAALVAVTAMIPVAGAYIGAFVGAFMILTISPLKALIFLIFILVLQQLEGNLIYPKVVGSSMGLPGIWVLAAVTVGGGLAGVLGMLFGVPLIAAIKRVLYDELIRKIKTE